MTEDFLHYIWHFQSLKPGPWLSTEDEPIKVIHPGFPNHNSGPDFSNARILIAGQLWIGSVEIHIESKDWYRHKHEHDPAYNNVILHVVYKSQETVKTQLGNSLCELSLKGLFDEQLYWRFEQRLNNSTHLACAEVFSSCPDLHKYEMLDRCAVDRMKQRMTRMESLFQELRGDWDALFYHLIAKSLGQKVNKEPMEMLARVVPYQLWRKHVRDSEALMALFLGMSGLLPSSGDAQVKTWRSLFNYLQHKHQLRPLEPSIWKYARMRPHSFPDRRIAQLASLAPQLESWFSRIRAGGWQDFKWPALTSFWSYHYRLSKLSSVELGVEWSKDQINALKINALVPILYFYGMKLNRESLQNKAFEILQSLPPETNKITKGYEQLGLSISSAYDSQACLTWHETYCRPKKCLTCTLGNELLNA